LTDFAARLRAVEQASVRPLSHEEINAGNLRVLNLQRSDRVLEIVQPRPGVAPSSWCRPFIRSAVSGVGIDRVLMRSLWILLRVTAGVIQSWDVASKRRVVDSALSLSNPCVSFHDLEYTEDIARLISQRSKQFIHFIHHLVRRSRKRKAKSWRRVPASVVT
jgi:hypothetical protein